MFSDCLRLEANENILIKIKEHYDQLIETRSQLFPKRKSALCAKSAKFVEVLKINAEIGSIKYLLMLLVND